MNSDSKNTRPTMDTKMPAQSLTFGLFGRRVSAPQEPAPKRGPSPMVDKAA